MSKTIFKLLTFILVFQYCTVNAQRRKINLSQADARFTIWAEANYNFVNDESIFYYIQNNTSDKYELEVEVTVNSTCHPSGTYKLGINRIVSLKPNGRFTPDDDWVHILIGGSNAKECRKKIDDKTFTFISGISYKYLKITNITLKEKQEADAKAKKEALELEEKQKKEAEALAKKEKEKKDSEELKLKKEKEAQELKDKQKKEEEEAQKAKEKEESEKIVKDKEEEKKQKEAEEQQKKEEEQIAAQEAKEKREKEAEERRIAEENAKRERQANYDKWKAEKREQQQQADAAAAAASISFFTLIVGIIYEDMNDVNPDFVFRKFEKKPKFYMGMDIGFSASVCPILFSSDYSTMIGGEYVETQEIIPQTTYTLNLDYTLKIGIEQNYYSAYAYFAPKIGISPIFDGTNFSILNYGGNVSLGAKWVKAYGDYQLGDRLFTRTSSDAEESGSGRSRHNFSRITYGLKFTTNPDANYCRTHIIVGLINESVTVKENNAYLNPNLETNVLEFEKKSENIQGYTFQLKKDHISSLYINVFPKYPYIGQINGNSGSLSSDFETKKSNLFIEIGFLRSFDLWN